VMAQLTEALLSKAIQGLSSDYSSDRPALLSA